MDDRIIRKIKACLALSQSPEPAEAAAAMRQAQKLMEKYNISMGEVKAAEIGETSVKSKVSVSRIKQWELNLVKLVAEAFGCRLIWSASSSYSSDVFGSFNLVGTKDQLDLAKYTCEVLQRKIVAGRAKFIKTLPPHLPRKHITIEADGFCHGWVQGVSKTVHKFALSDEHLDLIESHIQRVTGGAKAKVKGQAIGAHGLSVGREAGAVESLHRPVTTSGQARLGRD